MDWFEQVKFDEPKQKSIKNQIVFEKATEIIYIGILEETYLYIYKVEIRIYIYIYKIEYII